MIFECTPEHIERLSDESLRILVGYLAEQEVVRAGHSASVVTYSGHQDAKDGGIDVRVDLGSTTIRGFVPRAQTGYQVKVEDTPKAVITREMRPDGTLRPSIVALGENGGAYIIVSSKASLTDKALSERKNAMAVAIADAPSAAGLHVDLYDRRRLATWVNQHPGLIPWVRNRVGLPLSGWRPFEDWSSSPGVVAEQYLADDHIRIVNANDKEQGGMGATEGIERIRQVLDAPKGAVRLVGLSGVGKTRLVQALFDQNVGANALNPHLAIYADIADSPDPIPLELLTHLQYLGRRCVLIVDNCGVDLHRKLCARMRNAEGAVSVITVEYDISDDASENTDTFKLEPASSEIIEKIVARRYPSLSSPEVRTIATFSEGNSRIALALAETAQYGESLADLKDSHLIKRLFHQNHQEDPALLNAARAISLVYSFDGERIAGVEAELVRLASLAGQGVAELYAYTAELIRRQLVQKRSAWRALLPQALAHKLAKEALQNWPSERIQEFLVHGASARFLKSFSRRLGFLHDTSEAQAIVAAWLRKGGILSQAEELDETGIAVLENIAPVNPHATMDALQAAMRRSKTAFNNRSHLHRIVDILRSLAYEPDAFDKAATLIATLAEGEPESNNNGAAVNVFKSLFYIYLSGTNASGEQRANLLRAIAASSAANRQSLVLAALDAMLECTHFSSSYSFEFGARKRGYGRHPVSKADVQGWYRGALALAADLAEHDYLRVPIKRMIAAQFQFLAPATGLVDDLIALADRFGADGGWPEGWVGVRSAHASAVKHEREEDALKLAALEKRLEPETLESRLAIYVLPERWSALDVAEIDTEDESRYEKAERNVQEICVSIGKELASDLSSFISQLPKMLGSTSMRVATVAATIGRETKEPRVAWASLVAEVLSPTHQGRTFGFLANFLSGVAEADRDLCNKILDEALDNTALHSHFVSMQALAGIDDAGCARLIEAAKLKTVPIRTFEMLSYGRRCDDLPAAEFKALMLAIASGDGGLEVALDILQMRIFSKDKLSLAAEEKETCRVLLGKVAFERKAVEARILGELVRKCLSSPLDDALADQICERLLQGIAQQHIYATDYGELVAELGAIFPRSVLNILVEKAPLALQSRRGIFRNFRDHRPCPLRQIGDDVLLEWAKERPETRFLQLAEVIRPMQQPRRSVPNEDEVELDESASIRWTSAALRILHEAPSPQVILNQYVRNLYPGGWSGSLAGILASRISLLETLTQDAKPVIADAAKEALSSFKESVERERDREAQESRERDERFEW